MKLPTKGIWEPHINKNLKFVSAGVVAVVAIVIAVEQNRPYTYPPIPTAPLPVPNAYDYYRSAVDGIRRDEATVKIPTSRVSSSYFKDPPQIQLAVLRATAPDLKVMRTGFSFPCNFPSDRNNRNEYSYYSPYMKLADLLRLQGVVATRDGDWATASEADVDAIKLGVDLKHGGPIESHFFGVVCQEVGRKDLWSVLPHLSNAQTQKVKMRLISMEASDVPYADAQLEEKYNQQTRLQSYFKTDDWANVITDDVMPSSDGTGAPSAYDRLVFSWRLRITGKRTLYDQYSAYQDAVVEASRKPYAAHAKVAKVQLDQITTFVDRECKVDPYAANQLDRVNIVDSQTQNRLLIVTVALQQYYLKNHTYPKLLSQLTPAYLSVIPDDPFALSGPLRYIKFGKTYCLYSVGPDGVDNYGAAIGTLSSRIRPYVEDGSKGDVVAGVNP